MNNRLFILLLLLFIPIASAEFTNIHNIDKCYGDMLVKVRPNDIILNDCDLNNSIWKCECKDVTLNITNKTTSYDVIIQYHIDRPLIKENERIYEYNNIQLVIPKKKFQFPDIELSGGIVVAIIIFGLIVGVLIFVITVWVFNDKDNQIDNQLEDKRIQDEFEEIYNSMNDK